MREHFKQHITDINRDALGEAWGNLCDTGVCDPCWEALNLSSDEQAHFIERIAQKYKQQFTDDAVFKQYIQNSFAITTTFPYHVVRFAGETEIEKLLLDKTFSLQQQITDVKTALQNAGHTGSALIKEIDGLEQGMNSQWPVWQGSDEKLKKIVVILKALPLITEESLLQALTQDSPLSLVLLKKPMGYEELQNQIAIKEGRPQL